MSLQPRRSRGVPRMPAHACPIVCRGTYWSKGCFVWKEEGLKKRQNSVSCGIFSRERKPRRKIWPPKTFSGEKRVPKSFWKKSKILVNFWCTSRRRGHRKAAFCWEAIQFSWIFVEVSFFQESYRKFLKISRWEKTLIFSLSYFSPVARKKAPLSNLNFL